MSSDDMVSSDMDSTAVETSKKTTTKDARPPRNPKCTRCQNHGKKVQVKYHKSECEYRFCLCKMCILTGERQKIMKEQTAIRRQRLRQEMLKEMREQRGNESESQPSPNLNGRNDSNSSDMPSFINHNSNNSDIYSAIASESVGGVPPVLPPNIPPLLPHATMPNKSLLSLGPETSFDRSANLWVYSVRLLQWFGYPWESLSLMYLVLEASPDVEAAMRRITEVLQATARASAQLKSRSGTTCYRPGYPGPVPNTLGNPTYIGPVPYIGVASSPTTAGFNLAFPHSFGAHLMSAKVPSSPDSPPERPSSYPETNLIHHMGTMKIEKSGDTD